MDPDRFVEVIYEGKIMRVPETFAKEEGLPVIKKARIYEVKERVAEISERKAKEIELENKKKILDNFKKPSDWKANQVAIELKENFNWLVSRARKNQGLTRKQLSTMISEPESHIKALEYGTIPTKDFILINKIQTALNINLRKDGKSFSDPLRAPIEIPQEKEKPKYHLPKDYNKIIEEKNKPQQSKDRNEILGSDITIIDDDLE